MRATENPSTGWNEKIIQESNVNSCLLFHIRSIRSEQFCSRSIRGLQEFYKSSWGQIKKVIAASVITFFTHKRTPQII